MHTANKTGNASELSKRDRKKKVAEAIRRVLLKIGIQKPSKKTKKLLKKVSKRLRSDLKSSLEDRVALLRKKRVNRKREAADQPLETLTPTA